MAAGLLVTDYQGQYKDLGTGLSGAVEGSGSMITKMLSSNLSFKKNKELVTRSSQSLDAIYNANPDHFSKDLINPETGKGVWWDEYNPDDANSIDKEEMLSHVARFASIGIAAKDTAERRKKTGTLAPQITRSHWNKSKLEDVAKDYSGVVEKGIEARHAAMLNNLATKSANEVTEEAKGKIPTDIAITKKMGEHLALDPELKGYDFTQEQLFNAAKTRGIDAEKSLQMDLYQQKADADMLYKTAMLEINKMNAQTARKRSVDLRAAIDKGETDAALKILGFKHGIMGTPLFDKLSPEEQKFILEKAYQELVNVAGIGQGGSSVTPPPKQTNSLGLTPPPK